MSNFELDKTGLHAKDRFSNRKQNMKHSNWLRFHTPNSLSSWQGSTKEQLAAEFRHALNEAITEQSQTNLEERIKPIASLIFLQIQIHLQGWIEKVDAALTDAQEPPDEDSQLYWLIALGGNLLWAATSLIPATARYTAVIRTMSFVGAAIGSGSVEKISKAVMDSPENRKAFLREKVATFQSKWEADFEKSRFDWALEFDSKGISGRSLDDAINEFVWGKMFTIPFATGEGRYLLVYKNAKANIEKLLAKFNRDWESWKEGGYGAGELGDGSGRGSYYSPEFEPDLTSVNMQISASMKSAF